MAQEEKGDTPQRGTLLRRAHELLESLGQPVAEDLLIRHLFGVGETATASSVRVWTTLLRQALRSSTLFEEQSDSASDAILWSLAAWKSAHRPLEAVDFVVVDTETTGLRPGADRVIELGAVRLRNGTVQDKFQSLINPGRRIPPFIVKFTGISQEMLIDAPKAQEIMPLFLRFIDGAILVGHNLSFDLNFLAYEAHLLGQTFPIDGLDTIPLARRFLPGLKRFKLDMLAAHLHIPIARRHRALGDAEVTAEAFQRILTLARQQGIVTLAHLRRRLQLPVAWNGDITRVDLPGKGKQWRADGKLSSTVVADSRPNGSLFLNPAWKRNFPEQPGVYLMKDVNKQVIYVGKAKNLKNRLLSYYSHPFGYTQKMDGLLQNVHEIETRVLGSELEALLVESRLIKELQPTYNVQLRNYELYPFIKIDVQHAFPRVYATREVAADGARYFGPFRSQRVVDLAIELIQKLFPVRTCTRALPPHAKPSDPCLRLHLGRCSAPCRGGADPVAYRAVIDEVCAFLGGEREDLLDRLRRQMHEAAQRLDFERAASLRDSIRSVNEVLIGQRILTGAVEANNLFIVYPSAQPAHNEIFLVRHGRLVEQRCVPHKEEAMRHAILDLLAIAARLGEPPAVIGKAEVDQINIISRWLHHHSTDPAFFPFQHILADADAAAALVTQVWTTIEEVRTAPPVLTDEGDDE